MQMKHIYVKWKQLEAFHCWFTKVMFRAITLFDRIPMPSQLKGAFNIYVNKWRWVGGLANVYSYMLNISFFLLSLFTRGSQVVKKGQNFVYINIE